MSAEVAPDPRPVPPSDGAEGRVGYSRTAARDEALKILDRNRDRHYDSDHDDGCPTRLRQTPRKAEPQRRIDQHQFECVAERHKRRHFVVGQEWQALDGGWV